MTPALSTRFLTRKPGRAGLGGIRATGWYCMRREPTAAGALVHVPVAGPFKDFEAANTKLQTLLPTPEHADVR